MSARAFLILVPALVAAVVVVYEAMSARFFVNVEGSDAPYTPTLVVRLLAATLGLAFVGMLAWSLLRYV